MKYFIIAGEASGDLHGSNLMREILKLDRYAEFRFLGGDKMSQFGGSPVVHYKDMAFMGFINVLLNLNKIFHIRRIAEKEYVDFRPDKVILIDYPGFNLRFAKFVKHNDPKVEVNYYISPKLWAWKSYRIRDIKRYVDNMYTIFPFETEYFANLGYGVHYVGNPSVDSIYDFSMSHWNKDRFMINNKLDDRPIISLLAGSRRQEICSCLPLMVSLAERFSDYQFVVAAVSSVEESVYSTIVPSNVRIIYGATYELLSISSAAVVNSGTATLETALLCIPQVVVYSVKGGRFTMFLKDLIIKTKWVSLVNIIAQKYVVRELLAHEFTLENMSYELDRLLNDKKYTENILCDYQKIINLLGAPGTAQRCARCIVGLSEKK